MYFDRTVKTFKEGKVLVLFFLLLNKPAASIQLTLGCSFKCLLISTAVEETGCTFPWKKQGTTAA